MKKLTNKELQTEIERRFSDSLRDLSNFAGLSPHFSIHNKKSGRKLRDDVSAKDHFLSDSEELRVSFEPNKDLPHPSMGANPSQPNTPAERAVPSAVANPARAIIPEIADSTAELIRNLHRAVSRPGYDFVALKWFRDSVLPAVRPEWADPDARTAVLRDAIERRIVLTSKVPNPKSPMFPVTAIRLNRSLPEVEAILGPGDEATPDFQPVAIRGEALSNTVLRERR